MINNNNNNYSFQMDTNMFNLNTNQCKYNRPKIGIKLLKTKVEVMEGFVNIIKNNFNTDINN